MTSKHRKHLYAHLLPPRVHRFAAAPEDYGKTRLDLAWNELEPDSLKGVIGYSRLQDNQTSKSEAIQALLILIGAAQASSSATNYRVELDLQAFCQKANLRPAETEVVCLVAEGWIQVQIAEWLGFSQATVSRLLHSGRGKLATWLPSAVAVNLQRA